MDRPDNEAMKAGLKIYLLLSSTLIGATAWIFLMLYLMPTMVAFFLFPFGWACLVITVLYVFGTHGAWLFEASVGKLIEKITRE